MSELEKYFDRLQEREIPKEFINSFNKAGCTNWPSVEERIRETLDEWTDCQGYIPSDKHTKDKWIHGARLFVEALGEKPALLRKAWEMYLDIEWERRQRIIIETPRSLIAFARKVIEIETRDNASRIQDPELRRMVYGEE